MEKDMKEVYKALVSALNELENPVNSMDNPYYNARYVPLADILDLVKPIFQKHGLAIIQIPQTSYEETSGKHTEVGVVNLTTKILHKSGEVLEFEPVVFKAQGNTPQAVGSAITYARRYSLSALLGIAGKEDDDDGNIASNVYGHMQQQQYVQQNQNQNIQNIQRNNTVRQQPSNQPQPAQKQQQQQKPDKQVSQVKPNVGNPTTVTATVVKKSQGKTGKGTPYVELVLENEGNFVTALVKDEGVYDIAKGLKEQTTHNFGFISMNGFTFVTKIDEVQEASS